MSSDPDNRQVGQEIQVRFGFYSVALTFTILGLAIQTSSFGYNVVADLAELLAWLILLISGLQGLKRLEGLPGLYQVFGVQDDAETQIETLRRARIGGVLKNTDTRTGEVKPIGDVITVAQQDLGLIESKLPELTRPLEIAYDRHRSAFVSGIVLLVASRGLAPALDLLGRVWAMRP